MVASENIPNLLAQSMVGLDMHPLAFLLAVNVLLLLLGCVLDATTIILVIIPLFLPTCRELGIDLVHFGVVAVVNCMIGLITPPYGILLFVIKRRYGDSACRNHPRDLALPGRAASGAGGSDPVAGAGSVATAHVRLSGIAYPFLWQVSLIETG